MNPGDSRAIVAGEMKDGHLAESDKRLRVGAPSREIKRVGETIGSFAAARRDDGTDFRIADGVVDIRQTVFVLACEISETVEGVRPDFGSETETLESLDAPSDGPLIRRTRGRDEPYHIAGAEFSRLHSEWAREIR